VTNRRPTRVQRTPAQRPATDACSSGSPPDVDRAGATIYAPHTRRPSSLGHPFTLQWPPVLANQGIVTVEEVWRCSLCHTYQVAGTFRNATFGQYKKNTKLSPLGDLRMPSIQREIGRAAGRTPLWLRPDADAACRFVRDSIDRHLVATTSTSRNFPPTTFAPVGLYVTKFIFCSRESECALRVPFRTRDDAHPLRGRQAGSRERVV
jgi:hypothetical protein